MIDGPRAIVRAARWRVPAGFIVAPIVLWLAQPTVTSLLAGSAIAGIGEALRIWAAGHLNKSREVTSSGPYRWFAHPLYLGSSVMGLGLGIATNRLLVVLLIGLYLGVTIALAINAEEAFLRGRFGDDYDRYRRGGSEVSTTGVDSTRRFSVQRAVANREYRAIVGVAAILGILVLKLVYGRGTA